jgi:Phytanoyl-CoA dioxygenase (PhyH)
MTDKARVLSGVPIIESPFFEQEIDRFDGKVRRIARDLHEKGYSVLDFPEHGFEQLAESIKQDLTDRMDLAGWREGRVADLRIQDAWAFSEGVKRIATNKTLVDILSQVYGRKAFPFQTLDFPVGSQQHYHTDSVHFSSAPERFMCGVWVALEDIDADNGPLVYYPGSHRWPIYTNEHIGSPAGTPKEPYQHYDKFIELWRALIHSSKLEADRFFAKKGQALIWAANLLHGGDVHRDKKRTRWSQVTHYFFEGCAYYTPLMSDPFYGEIFFREPVDVADGRQVPNVISGRCVPADFVSAVSPSVGGQGRRPYLMS